MADYTLSAKITGDSSGFEKALSKAQRTLDSFETKFKAISTKMESVGNGFTSMGNSLQNVGNGLSKYITKPAMLAATALGGIVIGKGWSRMTQIDNARVKLEAIGNSADKVKDIMNNATASVKGTAFGLDKAATTAASAVAAGIEPGKKLEKYLTAVADAAAVAGVDMNDMGSIFNKVATQGKANNEVLQQMAEKGIPIYQYLGEVTGKSADQIFNMARKGEISTAMFQEAVEKNIGGAAKTIGSKTITGAISNLSASISRIGENFLGSSTDANSFAGAVLPMLNDLTTWLGTVEDKAKEWGATFGEVFNAIYGYCKTGKINFDELSASAGNIVNKILPIVTKVRELTKTFMNLSPTVRTALVGGAVAAGPLISTFGKVSTIIGGVSSGAGKLAGSFANIVSKVPSIGKIFDSLKSGASTFSNIKEVMLIPFEDLAKKFPIIGEGISQTWNATGGKLMSGTQSFVSNIIGKFTPFVSGITTKLSPVLSYLGTWGSMAGEAFSPLLSKIASFAPTFMTGMNISAGAGVLLAGLGLLYEQFGPEIDKFLQTAREKGPQIITNLCDGITSKLPSLIEQGGKMVTNILDTITANLPAIIKGGTDIIASLIKGTASQLPTLIPAAVDMVITLVEGLIDNLPALIDAGIELLVGLTDGLVNAIPRLVASVPKIITSLTTTIISKMPQLIEAGINLLVAVGVGLVQAIPQLIAQIPQILSAMWDAFVNVDWWDVGKNIISGIANGISSCASALWDAAVSAAKSALDKAKSFLGIHSPSTVFRDEVGKMMAMGMGIGFETNIPVQSMTDGLNDAIDNLGDDSFKHPQLIDYAMGTAENTYRVDTSDINNLDGVVIQVINHTNVDGTPLRETISDYTIRKIGNQQRAVLRARGV